MREGKGLVGVVRREMAGDGGRSAGDWREMAGDGGRWREIDGRWREIDGRWREMAGDGREMAGLTYLPTYLRMSRSPKMPSPSDLAGRQAICMPI